jgi:uncharacterized protein with PQ loop repeat
MLGTMIVSSLTLVVAAANVLGAAMAVPQARKLLRTRCTDGVSVTWAAVSATVNAWWAMYGIGVDDFSIVPVSVVSVVAYVVITIGLVRFSPAATRVLPTIGAVAVVITIPLIALHIDGWASAGIVLGALYGVQLSPAVLAVYRTIDVSGVAIGTWVIAFVEAALWAVYGLATADAGLITLAATGAVMSILVLVRLLLRRPRGARVGVSIPSPGLARA